ncbi:aldo/keto reductase [Streptomyces sp. NBC_01304]|uniref:aldo/keto reductase n=1 Tax=Streptomyces sp. NBC_01304 TaxID=2903818 RepID=UPI002E1025FE|nr:aldo/keto reductase [Streptomyces sp. NBC_01304]
MSHAPHPAHLADDTRYASMPYERCGRSGVLLPRFALGLWHNFGDGDPLERQRAVLRRAFDLGITHFDLANNYGVPYGSAEANFGRHFRADFRPYRDELFLATKAGNEMWPGPYGEGGSRKHLLASLDQSLARMGVEYVDVYYSHRPDPDTPLEETMGALATAVRQGKALYAGLSNYSPGQTVEAAALLADLGVPLLLNQHPYSLLKRQVEGGLLAASERSGAGLVVFSPLAQGQLTDRYLHGIPADSRMATSRFLSSTALTDERLVLLRALDELARGRGQSLAQLALGWLLREPRVTSVLVGASSVRQLEQNLSALDSPAFGADELAEIDRLSLAAGIELPGRA